MNLRLKRTNYQANGIFGDLYDEAGNRVAFTLEHAYEHVPTSAPPVWEPKLPVGIYTCKRGQHELHSGPIETFEVTGVEGHQGILIHPGNTEDASEGCILVGTGQASLKDELTGITESRRAFEKFLSLEEGQDQFTLTVEA